MLRPKKKAKTGGEQYIDKVTFYNLLVDYAEKVSVAKLNSNKRPQMPDEIGLCFLALAKNLAKLRKFSGYTYCDDMIGDAVENCIRYIGKFDTKKYNNPFGYFTTACIRAFIRRIWYERTKTYKKLKYSENIDNIENLPSKKGLVEYRKYREDFLRSYEDVLERKKEKQKLREPKKELTNLEKIMFGGG